MEGLSCLELVGECLLAAVRVPSTPLSLQNSQQHPPIFTFRMFLNSIRCTFSWRSVASHPWLSRLLESFSATLGEFFSKSSLLR